MALQQIPIHVLLVSFPAHGHLNPLLRLGKRLAAKGLLVTLSTAESFREEMRKSNSHITDQPTPFGNGFIRFEFFGDFDFFVPQIEITGKDSLTKLVKKQSDEGRPVSCLVNNPYIPWVCDVAGDLGIPCATLWIHSSALFAAYYHYFHQTVPFPSEAELEIDVKLPGMPVLKHDEIPSFLHPNGKCKFFGTMVLGQIKNLSKSFCVLADTFEELERDTIHELSKYCLIKTIGPLLKDPDAPNDSVIRGDLIMKADDCIEWLDSKAPSSVVYISFGTVVYLKQEQVNEFAHALLNTGLSFLWAMKPPSKESGQDVHVLPDGFLDKTGDRGKLVKWCSQEKVLAHPSVMCYLSHCGWNSTVEAVASGVPVVAFPQWGDQLTNAKFLVDVFGVGVRLGRGEAEDRVVPRDEVAKCLMDVKVGEKAEELKRNALKWKKKAEEAVAEGGSSDQNIQYFVDEIRKRSAIA